MSRPLFFNLCSKEKPVISSGTQFFHISMFSYLRLPAPCLPKSHMPNISLPLFSYMLECTKFHPSTVQLNYHMSFSRSISLRFGFDNSSKKLQFCKPLHSTISTEEMSCVVECCVKEQDVYSREEQTLIEGIQLNGFFHHVHGSRHDKECQRRQKIGLANKGKMPWNKGRSHSEETRERIRQRTKEAMKDPKVRKKMSECPRAHSNQTKARIQSSLRKLWAERLKWKRSREKFLVSWAESIAEAAKKGGAGQQELSWDSYNILKREIALEQLLWAAEKARVKEIARIKAERAAKARAEKTAMLAHSRKEREQKTKVREIKRKTHKKSKEEKEELANMQKLRLKDKLTKIHRKKHGSGQVSSQHSNALEKFDLEFEREWTHKEISFADQIFAAKSKRAESVPR